MWSKRLNSGNLGAARPVDYWVKVGEEEGTICEEAWRKRGYQMVGVSVRDHEAGTNVKCSGTLR